MTQHTEAAECEHQYWDCHEHRGELRVSDNATVYHDERGQLCWWELQQLQAEAAEIWRILR